MVLTMSLGGPCGVGPISKYSFVEMGGDVRASWWLESASRCLQVDGGVDTLLVLGMDEGVLGLACLQAAMHEQAG